MRQRRPINRSIGAVRDSRLFVIATEDRYAPVQYFGAFSGRGFHVKLLPTGEDGLSSPRHVLDRLKGVFDDYDIRSDDSLWLLLDKDRWTQPNHVLNFTEVLTQARQSGVNVAISGPCFDYWIALHLAKEFDPSLVGDCESVRSMMIKLGYNYNKVEVDLRFLTNEALDRAIQRSLKNAPPMYSWVNGVAFTQVGYLVLAMASRGEISIRAI